MDAHYSRRSMHRLWLVCGGLRSQVFGNGGRACGASRIRAEVRSIASRLAGTKLSKWPGCLSPETDPSVDGVMKWSENQLLARMNPKAVVVPWAGRHQLFFDGQVGSLFCPKLIQQGPNHSRRMVVGLREV